ncbi:MAG: hypothetical protein ACI4JM_08540 [Oscillospiraceae bacterium]
MKKKITIVISALAVFGSGIMAGMIIPNISADADTVLSCDINCDGEVNTDDLVLLKKHLFGKDIERTIENYSQRVFIIPFADIINGSEFVINSYDEMRELAEKCCYSQFKVRYDEEYFKTKSLIAVFIQTNTYQEYEYDFCNIKADDDTLTSYLDITAGNYKTSYDEEIYYSKLTNAVILEYDKSDFSGSSCKIIKNMNSNADESDEDSTTEIYYEKPVIYLYPENETDVNVKLNIKNGELVCTYPQYPEKTGWNVTAMPDGTVYNEDGLEYSYLYWEGNSDIDYDMSKGFVVKGEDTAEFLREKLSYMGLTPKEYNEFIVYWLPRMQNNKYNLISFQGKEYTDNAELDITPKPDSILRVFMAYKPLDEYIEIPEQRLDTFERNGFSVVEWGGSEYTSDIME